MSEEDFLKELKAIKPDHGSFFKVTEDMKDKVTLVNMTVRNGDFDLKQHNTWLRDVYSHHGVTFTQGVEKIELFVEICHKYKKSFIVRQDKYGDWYYWSLT